MRAKFFVILYENCSINCYCNFNPCGIFESMASFTPILNQDLEQGKLMAGYFIGGRKFSEIKVQKS